MPSENFEIVPNVLSRQTASRRCVRNDCGRQFCSPVTLAKVPNVGGEAHEEPTAPHPDQRKKGAIGWHFPSCSPRGVSRSASEKWDITIGTAEEGFQFAN